MRRTSARLFLGPTWLLPSFADHQHLEGVREERRASAALRRSRLCRRQGDLMRLLIDGNRAGTPFGRDVLEDLPLTASLLDDRQRAVAVRAQRVARARIESHAVGAG